MSNFLHSIRWRIQAWHGLILLLVIAAFCLTAYQLAWNNQLRRADRNLQHVERTLIRSLIESVNSRTEQPGPPSPARVLAAVRANSPVIPEHVADLFKGTEPGYAYFSLRDPSGQVLLQSDNFPADVGPLPQPPDGEDTRTFQHRRESIHRNPEGLTSVFGIDLTPEREEMRRFALSLAGVGFGVWIVGLFGGWWLAGRAIKPIRIISETATRIADGNLAERISTTGTESELDQLSRVLNATFERLHTAFERQKRFTADASHELRTPVTILLSETQRILKRERTVTEYRDAIETCHQTAERMRRLIEALLQLARQEASASNTPREQCDLATIVRDCAAHLAPLAAEKQLTLATDLQPAPVLGDPAALAILATNLIANALQHHDRPGGTVRIRTIVDNNHATLTVTDDGPGIPAPDLPHLFERFYRVDKARTGGTSHSGLGLAIAQTIALNHRATLTAANNTTNRGATFTLKVPVS
ncbi:MAG: ATP-binding protein [Nibricoccus sp.]